MTNRTEQIERALLTEIARRELFITGDQRISETDAAALLGYSGCYMRELRAEGKGPPAYRMPINGCRVSYRVADLALWIESKREDC